MADTELRLLSNLVFGLSQVSVFKQILSFFEMLAANVGQVSSFHFGTDLLLLPFCSLLRNSLNVSINDVFCDPSTTCATYDRPRFPESNFRMRVDCTENNLSVV